MTLVDRIRQHPFIGIIIIGAIVAGGAWKLSEEIRVAPRDFAIKEREFAIKERERTIEELNEKLRRRDEDLGYFATQTSSSQQGVALSTEEKELYTEGTRLWLGGFYNNALKKLEEVLSMKPDYANAHIIRGRIYLENLKQYQNALEEFRKGLDKDSDNKYLLYNLGLTYYYLRDLSLAIEWNQRALDQDPDWIIAIYNSALYHVDYGEKYKDEVSYLKAIDLYENVIERDREFAAAALFNLAALYARLAKQKSDKTTKDQYVKLAVELLDRAIEKEGVERLKKIAGEISVPYGEDLKAIHEEPAYKAMIGKWKNRFRH